jgi:hypothetical protein
MVVRSQPTSPEPSPQTRSPARVQVRLQPPLRRLTRPRFRHSTQGRRRSAAIRLTVTHSRHQTALGRTARRPTPANGKTAIPARWDSFAAISAVLRKQLYTHQGGRRRHGARFGNGRQLSWVDLGSICGDGGSHLAPAPCGHGPAYGERLAGPRRDFIHYQRHVEQQPARLLVHLAGLR